MRLFWVYYMKEVPITTEFIKVQDLLKFASLVSTGGEAKIVISEGEVEVNGETCMQRGRKLRPGDVVRYRGQELTVGYADH